MKKAFTMRHTPPSSFLANRHRGMALIIVLGMMSVVLVIATISIRLTLLSERQARNDRDRQIAFQAAEAALADAELDIMGPNSAANKRCTMNSKDITLFVDACGANTTDLTRGLCTSNTPTPSTNYKPLYATINFDETVDANRRFTLFGEFTGRTNNFKDKTAGGLSAKQPRYIVEAVSYSGYVSTKESGSAITPKVGLTEKPETAFLVTSVGYGVSENTKVMLQALIYKPLATPGC